jgi:hypothetical protein
VTRLFPAETTDPAAEATALSVPMFTLLLAALTLELRLDKAFDRSSIWVEYWPFASVLSPLNCCSIFESWSEIAETPFSLTFTFFKSCTEVLRLAASVQTAGLLVVLLQAVSNAAAITHAAASPLHRVAITSAECNIPVRAASPALGESLPAAASDPFRRCC